MSKNNKLAGQADIVLQSQKQIVPQSQGEAFFRGLPAPGEPGHNEAVFEKLALEAKNINRLKQVHFINYVVINYQTVDKFEGDIYLHDNRVSFLFKDVDYIVPLSNIRSGIKA